MCDVCVASSAVAAGENGIVVEWHKTPPGWLAGRRAKPRSGSVPLHIRAKGKAEGKARYQMRRGDAPWPKRWSSTNDLASVMMWYGFDVKWELVKASVRDWVRGKRSQPTLSELKATRRPHIRGHRKTG